MKTDLKLKEVAKLLQVSDKTIYRWISDGKIPYYRLNHQYRFKLIEINKLFDNGGISELDKNETTVNDHNINITELIKKGGIHYNISGNTIEDVLANTVEQINLPDALDRETLLAHLINREKMASTAVGNGIAIPHPRNPVINNVNEERIALCMLHQPVEFNALDNKKIHSIIIIISSHQNRHLQILSRISYLSKQDSFINLLKGGGLREEILTCIEALKLK